MGWNGNGTFLLSTLWQPLYLLKGYCTFGYISCYVDTAFTIRQEQLTTNITLVLLISNNLNWNDVPGFDIAFKYLKLKLNWFKVFFSDRLVVFDDVIVVFIDILNSSNLLQITNKNDEVLFVSALLIARNLDRVFDRNARSPNSKFLLTEYYGYYGSLIWLCDVILFVWPQVKILKLRPKFMCPILEWVNADCRCDFDCFWATFGVTGISIWHLPFTIYYSSLSSLLAPRHCRFASHAQENAQLDINCSRISLNAHCSYAPLGNNSTMSSMAVYAMDLFLPKILVFLFLWKVSFYTYKLYKVQIRGLVMHPDYINSFLCPTL